MNKAVDGSDDVAGFSFYPAENPDYGGDVFLSSNFNSEPEFYGLDSGQGGRSTIAHELGHALGLKHPADYGDETPPPYLIDDLNDVNHTVMSYTNRDDVLPTFIVDGDNLVFGIDIIYPQSYSIYDIATLQYIYGANTTYHTGNDIYTLSYFDYKIETIWDAGGEDTIDLSNTKGKTILDMHSGTLNSVDTYSVEEIISMHQDSIHKDGMNFEDADNWVEDKILTLYYNDLLYTGKNNFGIAEGVIIENVNTGSGDDIVIDNEVDNIINTGAGDDKIYIGSGGFDHIDGGDGNDKLYLDLSRDDINLSRLDDKNIYIVTSDNFGAEIIGVEELYFNDGEIIYLG